MAIFYSHLLLITPSAKQLRRFSRWFLTTEPGGVQKTDSAKVLCSLTK